MKRDKFLEGFYRERIEGALDQYVKKSEAYKKATCDAQSKYGELNNMLLTKEQSEKVDVLISAHIQLGSVYGKEAYKFGFWDGVRFMLYVFRLI